MTQNNRLMIFTATPPVRDQQYSADLYPVIVLAEQWALSDVIVTESAERPIARSSSAVDRIVGRDNQSVKLSSKVAKTCTNLLIGIVTDQRLA